VVVIDKTYKGVRSLSGKIMTALMIIGGLATLVFMASAKPLNFFGMNESGIAHADAAGGGGGDGYYDEGSEGSGCDGSGGTGGGGGGGDE